MAFTRVLHLARPMARKRSCMITARSENNTSHTARSYFTRRPAAARARARVRIFVRFSIKVVHDGATGKGEAPHAPATTDRNPLGHRLLLNAIRFRGKHIIRAFKTRQ